MSPYHEMPVDALVKLLQQEQNAHEQTKSALRTANEQLRIANHALRTANQNRNTAQERLSAAHNYINTIHKKTDRLADRRMDTQTSAFGRPNTSITDDGIKMPVFKTLCRRPGCKGAGCAYQLLHPAQVAKFSPEEIDALPIFGKVKTTTGTGKAVGMDSIQD